ncbi:MAG: NADH-quinone oxidoreductase subunit [Acidobacteriota bacterium]|jgi:NADH-quinone oxidoreductase subunit N|nr:NADH-quinone oxidoreductase subunit [Acidobacteriota bacterium]
MFLLQASTTALFDVADLKLIAPEIVLALCACVALVMEVLLPLRRSRWVGYFALGATALATVSVCVLGWPVVSGFLHEVPLVGRFVGQSSAGALGLTGFYGTVKIDGFAIVFKLIFLLSAALTVAISLRYLDVEGEQRGEYYSLVLFATTGMMFLASGYDLIVLYISLELMALTFYVLVGYTKRERRSNEAGMKYFLLGAFSSGILLYGMSLLFGVAGSTNLGDIAPAVARAASAAPELAGPSFRPMVILAMVALGAGLFFKIAAVPFHMWAPDAYQGAPTSVTAFLSTGSKAASFALLARIFLEALGGMRVDWAPLLGLVAAVTIMVGNWAAVTQTNAKRLLAYSSISNAGYLLLGVIAANQYGYTGLVVYLLVYTFMNVGAFGVLIALRRRGVIGDEVDDLTGLGQKSPGVALMMAIFMLSLGGLPVTGGFIGKLYLFLGVLERGDVERKNWYYWLLGWAALNTVVSFFYYVRFIRAMYIGDREADARPLSLSAPLKTALVVCAVAVILIGVYPQPFIKAAESVVVAVLPAAGPVAQR